MAIPFSVVSVEVTDAGAGLRVTFTAPPTQDTAAGATDGLNPGNYGLAGPDTIAVASASSVIGVPLSLDLVLQEPLTTGTWTLTCVNIQSTDGVDLSPPSTATFDAVVVASGDSVSQGANNSNAAQIIRKHLNKSMVGPFWDAIIKALAVGDTLNWDNARKAFDQKFKATASGIYLDRRAGDDGITRPVNVGMSDKLFRSLAIKTSMSKLTPHTLYEILEVFYGTDAVRAYSTTDTSEPFDLSSEPYLTVLLDEQDLNTITFHDADFRQASAATAKEVAAAITRAFRAQKLKAWAVAYLDPETGLTRVRIYSRSLGLGSSVRVVGGSAQAVLKFPTVLLTDQTTPPGAAGVPVAEAWTVSLPSIDTMRISRSGATAADLNLVRVGDYVNVFGANFAAVNRGSFSIKAIDVRYTPTLVQSFDVENLNASIQASVTTVTNDDMLFFRPTKSTIINGARTVVVAQSQAGHLDINLPATSRAVERTVGSGAYVVARDSLAASALVRVGNTVTVTTAANHGLLAGEWVFIDDVIPDITAPTPTAGNGTSTTDASPVTLLPTLADTVATGAMNVESAAIANTSVLLVGGRNGAATLQDDTTIFAITGSTTLANGGVRHTYSWTSRIAAAVPTEYHRLTTLPQTGNVLMAGGWDGANAFTTSNIYDIGGNKYYPTGAMPAARAKHEQVLLNDGTVFVCGGGTDDSTSLATTALFTPSGWADGTWAAKTSMSEQRCDHAAVCLSTGKVLIVGGRSAGTRLDPSGPTHVGTVSGTCEIYDPVGNTMTKTMNMSWQRCFHRAVLLPNDQVLVVGGYGRPVNQPASSPTYLRSCEIYDGVLGRWRFAGNLPEGRREARVAYLADRDQVLVFGGTNASGEPTRIDVYDVLTGNWSVATVPLAESRKQLVGQQLSNGTVLIGAGATVADSTGSATFELYVPASDSINGRELNGHFKIASVPAANQLTYSTVESGFAASSAATVTPATAVPATTIPGPYLLDPDNGVAITAVATVTTQDLSAHQQYPTLGVASTAGFPDENGYIVVNFGFENQMGPIRYLGLLDASTLILDYSFKMPTQALSGATVTLLEGKTPFVPVSPETIGALYITDSAAGRVEANKALDEAEAGGIVVNVTIGYPGDRGLGGEGLPSEGTDKLSDKVGVWAGNEIDEEVEAARLGDG
jgi:hypothetical protein